ncbi:MAG: NYN domain-containing protein [Coriobacteriia bacterium]|nr:NYN domain-containing protein [Coriobacteriia bacterium]
MRYIIDGYNVTRRDPATGQADLATQREALVARLAVRGRDLLGSGPIVVVFDGRRGGGADGRRGNVEARFSRDETADDLIARLVTGAGDTVVTSDAGLAGRVRGVGAAVIGAEACFEGRRARRRGGRYPASTAGLPPGANRVTEELKKMWLTDEE